MQPSQVLCVILKKTEKGFRVLLLKRKESKGGFWQPVCGKIKSGESVHDACLREMNEETGIKKQDLFGLFAIKRFIIKQDHITKKAIEPKVEIAFGYIIIPTTLINIKDNPDEEHEDFGWFSFDKAENMLCWEQNREAVRIAKKFIEGLVEDEMCYLRSGDGQGLD